MAKRFTDTDKWKKVWFRKLKPVHKVFWNYLCDNCDHAGIWDVDFELAEMFIGEGLDVVEVKEVFGKQFQEIHDARKWFIRDFIDFQYGELNPNINAHKSAIQILKREGVYEGFMNPSGRVKDKDTNTSMDKDKKDRGCGGKNEKQGQRRAQTSKKIKFLEYVYLEQGQYDKLAQKLGNKKTDDYIERLNNYVGSSGKKYNSHYHAILTWTKKDNNDGPPQKESRYKPVNPDCKACDGTGFVYIQAKSANVVCQCRLKAPGEIDKTPQNFKNLTTEIVGNM